jgi:hypothetical protein
MQPCPDIILEQKKIGIISNLPCYMRKGWKRTHNLLSKGWVVDQFERGELRSQRHDYGPSEQFHRSWWAATSGGRSKSSARAHPHPFWFQIPLPSYLQNRLRSNAELILRSSSLRVIRSCLFEDLIAGRSIRQTQGPMVWIRQQAVILLLLTIRQTLSPATISPTSCIILLQQCALHFKSIHQEHAILS